jgi:hypothetical protein
MSVSLQEKKQPYFYTLELEGPGLDLDRAYQEKVRVKRSFRNQKNTSNVESITPSNIKFESDVQVKT